MCRNWWRKTALWIIVVLAELRRILPVVAWGCGAVNTKVSFCRLSEWSFALPKKKMSSAGVSFSLQEIFA